jgi:hypothetical protein
MALQEAFTFLYTPGPHANREPQQARDLPHDCNTRRCAMPCTLHWEFLPSRLRQVVLSIAPAGSLNTDVHELEDLTKCGTVWRGTG